MSVRSGARSEESGAEQSVLRQIPPIGCGGWVEKIFLPRSYLGCMRCFLGSGQKVMQAMLSIPNLRKHC